MERKKRILIKNADYIITMNKTRQILKGGDMLIENNRILSVAQSIKTEDEDTEIIQARGSVVIPGMVNTHQHCAHTIVRNIPKYFECNLMDTLKLFYERMAFFDENSIYAAALGSLGDLLKTGCTTSCDMHYLYPRNVKSSLDMELLAAAQLGIRFHLMRGSLSAGKDEGCPHVPDELVEDVDAIVKNTVYAIEKYHDSQTGSMLQIGVAPCWLLYENRAVLEECRKIAECYQVPLHSHLADCREEFSYCNEKYGCTPVEFAEKMGYLKENSFFAHCIQLTKGDFARLGKHGVGVACCPNSDMILNSSVTRVDECLRRGIQVGIGVDGAASDNASNMMAELKSMYLSQKFVEKGRDITPEKVLYMATVGGAKVLHRDDIGCLAPNMMADFVMLNWDQLQYAGGKCDPVYAVVLSGDARMVDKVFVNGKKVVDQGRLTTMDETKTSNFINTETRKMLKRWGK